MTTMDEAPVQSHVPWRGALRLVISAALFLAALYVIFGELRGFHYHAVVTYVGHLRKWQIVAAIACTIGSYFALALYDVIGTRYGSRPMPLRRTAFASFVSYAVNNSVGMSGIVGGSLRYRLYSGWGLTTEEIARVIGFGVATFWIGFFTFAGSVLVLFPVALPPPMRGTASLIAPIALAVPLAYLLLVFVRRRDVHVRGWTFHLPTPRLAAMQIAVSAIDWVCAAGAFHVLLPRDAHLSFAATLPLFLLAQLLGVISNLPGGVGVFDAVIVALLSRAVRGDAVAGALIAFRAVYYVLPLIVAGAMLAAREIARRRRELARVGRGVARTVSLFVPPLFSAGIFVSGAVLLISGATPAERMRVDALRIAVPLPLVELAHLVGSMAGVGLLLLARGVQRRLNGAYVLSSVLLAVGIGASLLKGLDYEEAFLLSVVLGALLPCRRHFYRKTELIDEPFTAGWVVAIGLALVSSLWLGFFVYRRIEYSHELWWKFSFGGDAPRFLRATLGVAAVALAFSVRKLLRGARVVPHAATEEEIVQAAGIARTFGSCSGPLALLGDKALLFDQTQQAFVMYGVQGRSWVAMGDPVGSPAAARELAWRFYEEADRHNGWPVFYQVRGDHLPLYIDLGLTLLKVGEEARVKLSDFTMDGGEKKTLRKTIRRLEGDGLTFEMMAAEDVPRHLPELRDVSDSWLALKHTREKRFSLGWFDDAYMQRLPVATACLGGKIVAFANVWGDDVAEERTVDLMRHSPDAPPGVMDFLFVNLISRAREDGYRWFNLGVAPLAGVEGRMQGPMWSRIAGLGFEHGERFYNFQGLRQYKDKFGPVWQPLYLASPGGFALPRILTDIAALISGSVRGILMK